MKHPNAAANLGVTGLAALIVYAAGFAGLEPPPEVAIAVAGAAGSLVLFIGREGIRGLVARIWRGRVGA